MKTKLTPMQKRIINKRLDKFKNYLGAYSEENFNNFLEVSIHKNSLKEEFLNEIGFVKTYFGKYADTYVYENFVKQYKDTKKNYKKLEITFS